MMMVQNPEVRQLAQVWEPVAGLGGMADMLRGMGGLGGRRRR